MKRLCQNRNTYRACGLTMPPVDLTELPAVMMDAIEEGILTRERFLVIGMED